MSEEKDHDVKEDEKNVEKEVKEVDNSKTPDDENNGADPPPGEGLSEEVFEVDEILSHCYDEGGALYFQVRWRGYGQDDDSWEPAENLGSASNAIKAYWEEEKSEKRRAAAKKRGKKRSSSNGQKTDSSSKRLEKSKRNEKKEPVEREKHLKKNKEEPESEGDDHEDHVSEDDDDEYVNEKNIKKESKPVTKAALKAYDPPHRAARKKNSPQPPMSSAKSAAMKHRSSWLFEDEDSDDEEESAKKKKMAALETPKTKQEKKEPPRQLPRPDNTVTEEKPPAIVVEACPSPNITVVPDVIKKYSNYEGARIVRKEDLNGSSEIEGLLLNRDKSWYAVVKTGGGAAGIIPLEEAHAILGFKMMQFFLDRVVFK